MNVVAGLALVTAVLPAGRSDQPAAWLWQGRLSEVERISQRAHLCAIKNAEIAVMRGPSLFRNPEEPGAELSIPANEMTDAAKACMARVQNPINGLVVMAHRE